MSLSKQKENTIVQTMMEICMHASVKYYRFEKTLTTTVTAFRWPTKSMLVFQPSRSMIWAVGPELFMAWAETRYWPSGDQLSLRTSVVPPHWIKAREERGKTGSQACKQLKKESNKQSKYKPKPPFLANSLNSEVLLHWRVWWCLSPAASPWSSRPSGYGHLPGKRCTFQQGPTSGLSPALCVPLKSSQSLWHTQTKWSIDTEAKPLKTIPD